jgi:hypothetical protein
MATKTERTFRMDCSVRPTVTKLEAMIKKSLPDFRPAFEAYAADLKRAAERPL